MNDRLTHFDDKGKAVMVDITEKSVTERIAIAKGEITMKKETLETMTPILGKEDWGRGMSVWDFDGRIFYGHGGDTLGSHALIIYNVENNLSISYDNRVFIIQKKNQQIQNRINKISLLCEDF